MKTTRGRVLVVTSVFPRWDGDATPPFVQNQCELMVRDGWKVMVVAPHSANTKFRDTVCGVQIRRYPYALPFVLQKLCYEGGILVNLKVRPWTRLLLPILYLGQLVALLYLCMRFKPDLLHSHSLLPQGLSASWLSRLLGIPHVTTSHGNDVFGLKATGLMGRLKKSVIGSADAITVNSHATEAAVLSLGANPQIVHLIPAVANEAAVDESILAKINAEYGKSKRVLFVGRLIEEKGVLELLYSYAQLRSRMPDLQCFIVGEGFLRVRLEALASELSIASSVHFVGWRPREEIPSWMASADVLAVPSKELNGWQEAQGLVIVEAMAVGTIVVAGNVGGIPDMIRDGETGYLCDAQSVDSLVNALTRSLSESNHQELKAHAAQLYQDVYSRAAVQAKTSQLYEQVIAKDRKEAT